LQSPFGIFQASKEHEQPAPGFLREKEERMEGKNLRTKRAFTLQDLYSAGSPSLGGAD